MQLEFCKFLHDRMLNLSSDDDNINYLTYTWWYTMYHGIHGVEITLIIIYKLSGHI